MRLWMPHGRDKLCVGSLEDLVAFVAPNDPDYFLHLLCSMRNTLGRMRAGRAMESRDALTASGLGH